MVFTNLKITDKFAMPPNREVTLIKIEAVRVDTGGTGAMALSTKNAVSLETGHLEYIKDNEKVVLSS